MEYGMFAMPLRSPGEDVIGAYHRDVENFVIGDRLGYSEGWMGEHFTVAWEPIPACDLFISHVLGRTEQIRLGTGVVLLPMHDPRLVALRVAYLDHIAHGRLNFGIGAGGSPTDFQFWNINYRDGEHGARMAEAIDVIIRLWTEEKAFTHDGRFWQFCVPEPVVDLSLYYHMRPYQKPHPPIAVAGFAKASRSLETAGERGWIPMSINYLSKRILRSHWETISAGAVKGGRIPDRRQWRIAREIYVAKSDFEAREQTLAGPIARAYRRYTSKMIQALKATDLYKEDPDMADDLVTAEYVCDNIWIVGSPDTVIRKLEDLYKGVGGFGTVLQIQYVSEPWQRWIRCMELFAKEVMPNLRSLIPAAPPRAQF